MSSSPDTVHTVEIDIADLPTKSVTFAPTKATIIREIRDVQIKPGANEIIVLGLDPKLDPDSVRVDGYGSATITNIQTEVVPRKQQFEDVFPNDDDDDLSDSDLSALDDDSGPGKVAVDAARQEVRKAEAALAAMENTQSTAVKLLEFLDQYGQSMQAQEVEVSKMNDFLDVYRKQRALESERHQQSLADIVIQKNKLDKARQKLHRAEISFSKAKKAANRDIRQQQEKKTREKQQKWLEKVRTMEQRRRFWTTQVSQVVIDLDSSSASTPGSSRRSSVVSINEKHTGLSRSTNADGDTVVNLLLTYVVPSAKWAPRYELSINTPASSAKLVYRAEFENYTAETWKNAKITFSTSQTSFSGLEEKIPILDPWHIKLGNAAELDAGNKIWANALHSQKELSAKSSQVAFPNTNTNVASSSLFGPGPRVTKVFMKRRPPPGAAPFPGMKPAQPAQPLFGSSVQATGPGPVFGQTSPFARNNTGAAYSSTNPFGGNNEPDTIAAQAENTADDNSSEEDEEFGFAPSPELHALGHQDSQRQSYGLTTTYELPGQRTIIPSSVKRRNVITELDLTSVTISHVLVPKLRCAAFLKARITNTTSVSLVRGKAGMTVDGTFLGSTLLPNCEPDNFVDLSLGVDPSIQVTYAKPTVRRATSGFFAKDDSAIFTRTCWIKNTKKVTASITVLDQVPVSEDERLRVNILEPKGLEKENDNTKLDAIFDKGAKGKGQVYLGKNGQVKWTIDLRPGKDVKLVLEYESRIPSGQRIIGLN